MGKIAFVTSTQVSSTFQMSVGILAKLTIIVSKHQIKLLYLIYQFSNLPKNGTKTKKLLMFQIKQQLPNW